MLTWYADGSKSTEQEFNDLKPSCLLEDYKEYKEMFKDISLSDVVEIKKVEALLKIAEMIGNFPELFAHYSVVKPETKTSEAISEIAEAIRERT